MNNKLKSNRGATMILALALVLICITISSVILVVAASGSGRMTQQVEEQQAYLAVSSAADILATELNACNSYKATNNGITDLSGTDATGVLGDLMKIAASSVCSDNYYNNATEFQETITLSLQEASAAGRLPDAICEFTMDASYNVEMIVKTADSNYSIVIRCKATKSTRTVDDVSTTTVTWSDPSVTKGVGN